MDDSDPTSGLGFRTPPSNLQAEQHLLGSLLANNKALDRCGSLRSEHFADPINGRVYQAIARRVGAGQIASAVTLRDDFQNSGVLDEIGGPAYLARLLASMVGIINAADYANSIRDAALRRQLINIGETLVNLAFSARDKTAAQIASETVGLIDAIAAEGLLGAGPITHDDALDAALAAMERAKDGPTGMPTGFRCVDQRLGGLERGLVYAIGGRPGMGKSSLGHNMALNLARAGFPVLELSLEMSSTQLGRRSLATAARVPIRAIQRGSPSDEQAGRIVVARKEWGGLPIHIDDAGGQTPDQIATKVRLARRKHGTEVVLIDHLNLIRPDPENARENATTTTGLAADALLRIAKESNVAILELVQLNRGLENREDKRPGLSDLRQSGSIEQDAYAVGFVYRPEYYLGGEPERLQGESAGKLAERQDAWREQKELLAGKAELIWAKVRDGESGTDQLLFDGPTTTFSEVA